MLRIKEILKQKGITGKDLAKAVGTSENNMSRIIRGDQQPRFDLLNDIATFLDVDFKDLFNSTKNNFQDIYIKDSSGNFIPIGKIQK